MNYSAWELDFFDKSQNFRYYQYSLIKKFLKDEVKLQKPLSKEQDQLGLFDLENKILNELKDIDLNKISPIEALNKLNELKNKYNL